MFSPISPHPLSPSSFNLLSPHAIPQSKSTSKIITSKSENSDGSSSLLSSPPSLPSSPPIFSFSPKGFINLMNMQMRDDKDDIRHWNDFDLSEGDEEEEEEGSRTTRDYRRDTERAEYCHSATTEEMEMSSSSSSSSSDIGSFCRENSNSQFTLTPTPTPSHNKSQSHSDPHENENHNDNDKQISFPLSFSSSLSCSVPLQFPLEMEKNETILPLKNSDHRSTESSSATLSSPLLFFPCRRHGSESAPPQYISLRHNKKSTVAISPFASSKSSSSSSDFVFPRIYPHPLPLPPPLLPSHLITPILKSRASSIPFLQLHPNTMHTQSHHHHYDVPHPHPLPMSNTFSSSSSSPPSVSVFPTSICVSPSIPIKSPNSLTPQRRRKITQTELWMEQREREREREQQTCTPSHFLDEFLPEIEFSHDHDDGIIKGNLLEKKSEMEEIFHIDLE